MTQTIIHSLPAEAGKGIDQENEMSKLLMQRIEVQEIILPINSIRMDMNGFDTFCRTKPELPVFQLTVEKRQSGIIVLEEKIPYLKVFTVWNNCCIFTTIPIGNKEPLAMEGGEIHVQ